jgi:hypothetical protein
MIKAKLADAWMANDFGGGVEASGPSAVALAVKDANRAGVAIEVLGALDPVKCPLTQVADLSEYR